jgi:ribonuclease PH
MAATRAKTTLRPFSFRTIEDSRTLGTIYFEAGDNVQMLCKVTTEISSDPLISSRRNAKVKVTVTGGSTNPALINRLENVFSGLIPSDTLEKMQVQVRFEVLKCDGALHDYLINVGQYTMMWSNLLLKDNIMSATCMLTSTGEYILDPTEGDLKNSVGQVRLVHSVQKDKLVDFEIVGLIKEGEELREALTLCVAATKTMGKKMLELMIAGEAST